MCGIAGIIDLYNNENYSYKIQSLNKIIDHQHNRGPDSSSIWSSDNEKFFIGFNWLAIQDVQKNADQPFFSKDKKQALIFNGEIFNFNELKKKYLFSINLKTNSDTEVLFELLIIYGESIVKELEGFFSFAFFNFNNNKFFLARDRFGIKPLYYFIEKKILYFASTFKILNKLCNTNAFDLTSEVSFYLFGSIYGNKTSNKKIKQINPGTILNNKTEELENYSYYSLNDRLINNQHKNISVEQIYSNLDYIMEKYSVSQADWSLMLSSGVDSNIIKNILNNKVTTYTLLFHDHKIYSEETLIEKSKNNIFLEFDYMKQKEYVIDDYIRSMEQPTIDGLNIFIITKLIKKYNNKNKVCLTGLGLDELLNGYNPQKKILLSKMIFNLTKIIGNNFFNKYLKNMNPIEYDSYFKKNINFKNYILFRLVTPFEYLSKTYDYNELKRSYEEIFSIFDDKIKRLKEFTNNNKLIFDLLNFEFYLKDQLLKDGDNMSMSNSIELRFPFLEHNFVEQIFSYRKFNNLDKRILANKFIKDKRIINKKKTGFSFPIQVSNEKNKPIYFDYQNFILKKFKENINL